MKPRFIFILSLLVGLYSCASTSVMQKTPATMADSVIYPANVWLAFGTEPYWSLQATHGQAIVFTTLSASDSISLPEASWKIEGHNTQTLTTQTERYHLKVTRSAQPCSDGMSETPFSYKATVVLTDNTLHTTTQFNGCAKLVQPVLLNDIWVLEKLEGHPIGNAKRPTMELRLSDFTVEGNAGCNGYKGQFSIVNDQINFDQRMIATRMYCEEHELEDVFLRAIAGQRYVYEVKSNQLILSTEGQPLMVFKKAD